jgi:hypothetical protein
MTKAVEKLEKKVSDVEDKIRIVKELLTKQDQRIITEIHQTKDEFLKNLENDE